MTFSFFGWAGPGPDIWSGLERVRPILKVNYFAERELTVHVLHATTKLQTVGRKMEGNLAEEKEPLSRWLTRSWWRR
jgi:hypothetical protein